MYWEKFGTHSENKSGDGSFPDALLAWFMIAVEKPFLIHYNSKDLA